MNINILLLAIIIIILMCVLYFCYNIRDNEFITFLPKPIINENLFLAKYIIEKPPNLYLFNNNTLMVYKACEDIRKNIIRILCCVLLKYDKENRINVKINNKEKEFGLLYYGLAIKTNRDFPLKYANLILPYQTNITTLKVNDIEIPFVRVEKIHYQYDYTVCISSIKNNYSAINILNQTISIYRKLGVSHIIIYFGDVSENVYNLLKYYESTGYLEIYYWPQLTMLQYIRNFGQILKMNDCLYRSYYNSKYIINTDMDEIIVPVKKYSIEELISEYKNKNEECRLFIFDNKIFPKRLNYVDKTIKSSRKSYFSLSPVEDCDLFNKTLCCLPTKDNRKYIVSTKDVETIRFHGVVGEENSCYISSQDGYVHHTRNIPTVQKQFCKMLSNDYTLLKYK